MHKQLRQTVIGQAEHSTVNAAIEQLLVIVLLIVSCDIISIVMIELVFLCVCACNVYLLLQTLTQGGCLAYFVP